MTIALLITLPVILPLAAGVVLAGARTHPAFQRLGLIAATAANLVTALALFAHVKGEGRPLTLALSGWEVPVAIAFHADLFSALMILVTAVITLAGALYTSAETGRTLWRRRYAFFFLLLLVGINGAFLTADLFNLFVCFEIMLMASFVLMALGRRKRTFEGATLYVVINVIASFFFLSGLGILYGKTGTLNLADVAARLAASENDALILTSASLLLLAFGIKAGAFPLFFWLPGSYPHMGFTTSAVFGGLLTKVGVYALIRVFGGAFGFLADVWGDLFLWVGAATMTAGVLGAATQYQIRLILSWHIISQIGYLILGFGLFTQAALGAAIFYTIHHIVVKTNLFFAAGLIARSAGSEHLDQLGGLLGRRPFLAALFAVPALSLSGIPPLSGFFAKLLIIRETFREGAYLWGGIALLTGVLTLFSMAKIWSEAFWKEAPPSPRNAKLPPVQLAVVLLLGSLTLLFGLGAEPLYRVSLEAASQIQQQNPITPILPP